MSSVFFSETWHHVPSFPEDVAGLLGKTNAAPFRGYEAGEVRLVGVTKPIPSGEVTFFFEAAEGVKRGDFNLLGIGS